MIMVQGNPDSDAQLDVDTMTLDYLVHEAFTSIMVKRKPLQRQSNDLSASDYSRLKRSLDLVDLHLTLFKTNYGSVSAPRALHFRLQLLKFTTLFITRFSPSGLFSSSSLAALRSYNFIRASSWLSYASNGLKGTSFSPSPQPSGLRDSPHLALLDLLPSFMALSASRARLDSEFSITSRWMHLACSFMLQACIEQFTISSSLKREVIAEAFAWGYTSQTDSNDDDDGVNVMFKAESPSSDDEDAMEGLEAFGAGLEIEGWRETRDDHRAMLQPEDQDDMQGHISRLIAEHPRKDFETRIRDFLLALGKSVEAPVLVQLERGQLEGMSVEETMAFKRKVGYPGMWQKS